MTTPAQKIFWDIINCPNIKNCHSGSPCFDIISSQCQYHQPWHSPEPWTGDIENARLLFVSSNPSIMKGEVFPYTQNVPLCKKTFVGAKFNGYSVPWPNNDIERFFESRLQGQIDPVSGKQYVSAKKQVLCVNGKYSRSVPTWVKMDKYASAILGKKQIQAGIDYAICEVVKCKSKNEYGVPSAMQYCFNHFNDTIGLFSSCSTGIATPTICILGKKAEKQFNAYLKNLKITSNPQTLPNSTYVLNGTNRLCNMRGETIKIKKRFFNVIYAPHPTAHIHNAVINGNNV